jgi:hypothetical protein
VVSLSDNQSTGGSLLNGDYPLKLKKSIKWLYDNWKFLRKGRRKEYSEIIKNMTYNPSTEAIKKGEILELYTPSRLLCNSLWDDLNWDEIAKSLGGKVRILECGCGNGRYGRRVVSHLHQYDSQYLGFDAVQNDKWETFSTEFPNMKYSNMLSTDIASLLDTFKPNLIISQSAIEHFPDDFNFFKSISEYCNSSSNPIIQIHMIPSPACLPLYLLHGYRQYCSININRIIEQFRGDFYVNNIHLGGWLEFWTMFFWVTLPTIGMQIFFPKIYPSAFRRKFKNSYMKSLRKIITKQSSSSGPASFFCLIIGSSGAIKPSVNAGEFIPVSNTVNSK